MGIRRNTKGQVSIFLVFLFQVLFVFFAMVVNVGLLVYYKINLQNSVDLAAYYAATKQAQMLNTIGHINYQMRQSWKLLAYRTTLLGTLGPDLHPARPKDVASTVFNPYPGEVQYKIGGEDAMPIFCVTVNNVYANTIGLTDTEVNKQDNQCRYESERKLSGFKIPEVIWSLPGYNEAIRQGAINLQDKFLSEFAGGGFRNFNTLASFVMNFRADSLNRRKVIAVLGNSLSASNEDFFDIESKSVYEGANKVLNRNLAEQNQVGLTSKLFNSLADPNCGGADPNSEALPGWLKEIEVFAIYPYLDSNIGVAGADASVPAGQKIRCIGMPCIDPPEDPLLSTLPSQTKILTGPVREAFDTIGSLLISSGLPGHPAGRWTTAIGVEKNPWCMPYIGFKASSKPRLPFMPDRFTPTLQAKAFAKPFGGKIGPWYGRMWPAKTARSGSDPNLQTSVDKLAPPRINEGLGSLPKPGAKELLRYVPNYSRFVGDTLGYLSEGARWAYGKYYWNNPTLAYHTNMWKQPFFEGLDQNASPNSEFFMGPKSGDILAEAYRLELLGSPSSNIAQIRLFAARMRQTELAAIAPDLFDIAYYTIEPRFNQYLLPRMQAFVSRFNNRRQNLLVRGDLGWRKPEFPGEPGIGDVSANVETQINVFRSLEFYTRTGAQIFQTIADPSQLLTSWAETSIIDYDPAMTANKIGACRNGSRVPAGADPWTPGACVSGGRTGYSVKIVSKKFLESSIPDIGGAGVSDKILNPPDTNF